MSWDFVYRMEDVLDLYAESYDPLCPVVCFDERPVQLVVETRVPIAPAPGRPERFDYEYRCVNFMSYAGSASTAPGCT